MTDLDLDILAEKEILLYSTFQQSPVFVVDQAQHYVDLSQVEISLQKVAAR